MARQRLALKDHLREALAFNQRVVAASVLIALGVLVLVLRMAYLQIHNHDHYSTLSRNNRVSVQPIPPTRGLIYDRNGVLLAENLPSFSLQIVPERVADLEGTLAGLSALIDISAQDIGRFRQLYKRKRRFEAVPLRFRLSEDEVARIAVHRHRLPGVEINAQLARHYPLGTLTGHAVGYVGRINEAELRTLDTSAYSGTHHIGKVGVERFYEDLLLGQVGFQQVETNAQGRIQRVLERTPPVPGKNLYLNLDVRLQAVAEQAFAGENGALVAIDPNDGAVLAFVSMPAYDPNLFVNGIDQKSYAALQSSPDRPLFNRALHGQYPPGSTIKPFVGLAGLESGEVSAEHSVFCPGWYTLKGDERRYRDWKRHGHGRTNLDKSIVESCDVYYYDLALALGIDRLHGYLSQFGFGSRTGIDMRGEPAGLMPSREWKRGAHNLPWFPGETLITGIGQGFTLTTPLQLAATTATLAAQGQRHQPRLLHSIAEPGSGALTLAEPQLLDAVPRVRQGNWDHVIRAMKRVVHGATGTARRISEELPYTIAGKTGTAQVFGLKQDEEYVAEDIVKKLRDHALFVAFAPVDQPRIAVAVIVENGGSGGAVASPIARQVMDQYLLGQDDEASRKHTAAR